MVSERPRIEFVRLNAVPLPDVVALLNEPRNARHMPLAGEFSEAESAEWMRGKDAQWDRHGYGPWGILLDGVFAGWGGFQYEDDGPDFALVLRPEHWGRGASIARAALDRGFEDFGFDVVFIALPFTRRSTGAVARWGFVPDGEVSLGGSLFRRYRLTREVWAAVSSGDNPE